MRRTLGFGLSALAFCTLAVPSQADVLVPGQKLRVTFTVSSNLSQTPDVLTLNFGLTNVIAPFTSRVAEIYDGNTLLGTHTDSLFGNYVGPLNLDPSNTFAGPGSLYTFLNPATIDFTTIANGTIVGTIDYSILTGAHDITLSNVNLRLGVGTGPSSTTVVSPAPMVTSVMIVDPGAFTSFCPGDGSAGVCPCGNPGGAGEGCANSTGGGALLAAGGSSSAGADDLTFACTGLLPAQPALLFAGENAIMGGNGMPFGDGLRCAGQNVVRLGTMTPDANGDAAWGPGLGATGGWGDGDTRYFQAWYRDPVGGPCGTGFNLSNGVQVDFGA